MHPEARAWVAEHVAGSRWDYCVEVGSRDVNGGVRDLIDAGRYLGIDREPGPGVDHVVDAHTFTVRDVDLVVCCEVLEHDADPAGMVERMWSWLRPGGRLVVTCATEGRAPHSAMVDGAPLPGEFYENVPASLFDPYPRGRVVVDAVAGDLRVMLEKPRG